MRFKLILVYENLKSIGQFTHFCRFIRIRPESCLVGAESNGNQGERPMQDGLYCKVLFQKHLWLGSQTII